MVNRRGPAHIEPRHPASSAVFTVRYCRRSPSGAVAFLVADDSDSVYLFSGGILQLRFTGDETATRLERLLSEYPVWSPVPAVAPYSIEGLQQLAGGTATHRK